MTIFPKNSVFFLGGRDLEMLTIHELLLANCCSVHDHGLAWGAKSSAYRPEITATLDAGQVPILVELDDDMDLSTGRFISVDHHGANSGKDMPTSLEQVFAGLNLPREQWSRHYALVSANDRGYIPGMKELNATEEELQKIRAMDRKAQGITDKEEREAESALLNLETLAEGELAVVYLTHRKCAAVCDRLELNDEGYRNLLIICPGQVAYFGLGSVVTALVEAFPAGSWWGGALPERGYWGSNQADESSLLSFLMHCFNGNKVHS